MEDPDLRQVALKRFVWVWILLGSLTLVGLIPVLFVKDRLVYFIFWLGISEAAWGISWVARARLTSGISSRAARILGPVIAVLVGALTALTAVLVNGQ
jgi:hypothetical protein